MRHGRFVDTVAEDGDVIDIGDATAVRADVGFIVGFPMYAGAVAGLELGRTCE
jgi:hypothetical protein